MNRSIATLMVLGAWSSMAASASAQTEPGCRANEDGYQACDSNATISRCVAEAKALECKANGRCTDMTTLPCPTRTGADGAVQFCCVACAPVVNSDIPAVDDVVEAESESDKRAVCVQRFPCASSPNAPGCQGGGGVGGSPHGYCPNQVDGDIACEGQSPIILDLGRTGFSLTSVEGGVDFDIDGDGVRERTAWTARGAADAFLALDRNGNGTIDGGRELFGNVTLLANGKTGAHGYIALGELDLVANGGNGNGYVDQADRGFGALLLWTDRDHDGRSSSDELVHLSDRGVFAIGLDADESDVVDEHGNRLAFVSPAYAWGPFRIERIRTTDIFQYRELAR